MPANGNEGVEVGHDLHDAPTGHESAEVEPVRADVGHRPEPSRFLGLETPVPVGVAQQPVLVIGAGDEARLTDITIGHHRHCLVIGWIEPNVEADRVHQPGIGGTSHEIGCVLRGDRERFLTDNVFAGGKGCACLFGVGVIGAGDVDDVDRRIGSHLLDAVVHPADADGIGLGPGALRRRADHTGHLDAKTTQRLDVCHPDESNPHHSGLDLARAHGPPLDANPSGKDKQ